MATTPGPWTVGGQSGNTGEAEEIAAANRVIAWTADTYDEDDGDGHITAEARANARLIAAAPELLEALREAAAIVAHYTPFGGIYARFTDLIERIEGE